MEETRNQHPRISVIVPTYERSDLLPRALDSIYAQSWDQIQVVVVDDNLPGSDWEAKTRKALEPYWTRRNFLYLKTKGKIGGGAARNFAVRQCCGDYVAFLDDDDRYLPGKLERQIQFILERNLDGCFQDVIWMDSHERQVEYRSMHYTDDYTQQGLLKAHILHSICPTSIYMLRRDRLLETEGFGEVASGQDFILMLRCIEHGFRLGYMPGAYVVQYLHDGPRVSLGESKLLGENMLYDLKHHYFSMLSKSEQKYVDFRHYAVLAFSSMRGKQWISAISYALLTVAVSPIDCVREAARYLKSKFRRT